MFVKCEVKRLVHSLNYHIYILIYYDLTYILLDKVYYRGFNKKVI